MDFGMMTKKSQSLSINTIIVAALALVVLVILILVFTGKIKDFSSTLESCAAKQGDCLSKTACTGTKVKIPNTECEKTSGNICCIQVLGT